MMVNSLGQAERGNRSQFGKVWEGFDPTLDCHQVIGQEGREAM